MLEERPVDNCFFVEDFLDVAAASLVRVTDDSVTNKMLNRPYTACSTGGRTFCTECSYALSAHRRRPVALVVAPVAAPRTVESKEDIMEACKVNKMSNADADELLDKFGRSHFNSDVCRRISNAYAAMMMRAGTSTRFHFTDMSAITLSGFFDEQKHPCIMSGFDNATGRPCIVKFVPVDAVSSGTTTPPHPQPGNEHQLRLFRARMELKVA